MSDEVSTEVEHALLRNEMERLRSDFETLAEDVRGMVDVWKAASGVLTFIKGLAALVTLVAGAWAVVKMKFGG